MVLVASYCAYRLLTGRGATCFARRKEHAGPISTNIDGVGVSVVAHPVPMVDTVGATTMTDTDEDKVLLELLQNATSKVPPPPPPREMDRFAYRNEYN